jgi:hypothetical protein
MGNKEVDFDINIRILLFTKRTVHTSTQSIGPFDKVNN